MDKEVKRIITELHPLERKIIRVFKEKKTLLSSEIKKKTNLSLAEIERGNQWLIKKGIIEVKEEKKKEKLSLTPLGKIYAQEGLPEIKLVKRIPKEGLSIKGINIEEFRSVIGELKGMGVLKIDKGRMRLQNEKEVEKLRKMEEIVKKLRKKEIDMEEIEEEVKGLVREKIRKRGGKGVFKIKVEKELKYRITGLGEKLMKELKEEVEEISALTPEIIKEGSWRGKLFREYNIEMGAPRRLIGRFHPYKQFLHYVREKLVSLGFEEVSGEFVETEFWNMDALFMPQNHPARELHDVYFVKSPEYGKNLPSSLLSEVAKTHENGGKTGSCGWGYKFDKKKSRRLLLRSQGTAISVRLLALKPKPPKKYFSIARCFRKEAIDATHGDEFFQIEGIVVDKGVNFRTLLGLLEVFAVEIAGAKEVKFLPDYFPFTEPSVEVHGKHPEFGWLELGGAGIFREEVTLPLGVKVPVLAWGLGLDRMAMMGLNIKDIRELFSRDLGFLREVVYKL